MTEVFAPLLNGGLAVAMLAVMVAGFLRGFVGFGAALVSVPVLSLVYGPLIAVPVSNLIGMPAVALLLPDAIRHAERSIVVPASAAIFFAAPFGAWLLVGADQSAMKVVIAALVIVMVAMLARGWRLRTKVTPGVLVAAGVAGGLIQGSAGIGGPPVVAVALSRPGESQQQRGNVLAFMSAISLSSVLPFAWFGLFTAEVFSISLLLFVPYVGFTWVGAQYFSGRGRAHFRTAALWLLLVIATVTLVVAIKDYL